VDTLRRRFNSSLAWLVLGLLAMVLLGLLASCTPAVVEEEEEDVMPSVKEEVKLEQEVEEASKLEQEPALGQEVEEAPKVGRLAPDFTLLDLDGNTVALSDFRGKAVFINFWATWCPPCRAEMPDIEAIYKEYKNKDVMVIGVDILEAEDVVRQYVQQGGFSWTFVIDTTGEVADNYGVTAIPTSFFLDKEGVIRAVDIGDITERAMESQLAKAMK